MTGIQIMKNEMSG